MLSSYWYLCLLNEYVQTHKILNKILIVALFIKLHKLNNPIRPLINFKTILSYNLLIHKRKIKHYLWFHWNNLQNSFRTDSKMISSDIKNVSPIFKEKALDVLIKELKTVVLVTDSVKML